ncbi:sel1 repeat family protein [Duganella sp. FT135W]|uniref:Sel1 repeat family protein n=1 Tax=Duganella flavida TaxID=2692175 RepID=A0A6L8K296_9BURK|nr:tetratricopeptide repeat protein [Duganella flavida]MYM21629.1 sel1 repeat family protein [Duganella flavida]
MKKTPSAMLSILLFAATCPASHAGSWNKPTPNEAFSKGDYQTALRGFTDRAMLGEDAAQDNVGMMYAQALGTERDVAKAASWYRKAAEQGYAQGQRHLAGLMMTGEGVEQDIPGAIRLYQKAVDQGLASAQRDLGSLYEAGNGVTQDNQKALELFTLAANQGDAFAQERVAALSRKAGLPARP